MTCSVPWCGCHRKAVEDDREAAIAKAHLALRNVLMLSRRIAKKDPENAEHLRRFCAEAGIVPSVTRDGGET